MSPEEGKKLIRLARDSISSYFTGKDICLEDTSKFREKQGVFVTLTKNSRLRGCIGFASPVFPLQDAIIEAAKAAAFEDPRFPPLNETELEEILIEISVLTVPELIRAEKPNDYLKNIEIGKHGLIIRKGIYSGLLLPQVFTEHKSSPRQALEMTCQKSGLPSDAWESDDAQIFRFSAQIFREKFPGGKTA